MLDHQHLIVRAEVMSPPTCTNLVKDWLKEIIDAIGMKLASGLEANPISYYCELDNNKGLTAAAILETSHVVVHFWDDVVPGIMQFDLYSCSHIDIDMIFSYLTQFKVKKVQYKFIDRNHGLADISEGRF